MESAHRSQEHPVLSSFPSSKKWIIGMSSQIGKKIFSLIWMGCRRRGNARARWKMVVRWRRSACWTL